MRVRFVDENLDEGLLDVFGKAKNIIFKKLGIEPKITKGNFYKTFEDTLFASLVKKLDLDKEQQETLKDEMPKIIEKVKSNAKVKLAISNAKTVSVNEEMLLNESVADKVSDSIINAIASVAAVIYMILLGLKFTIEKSALFVLVGLSFIVSLVALIGSFTYGFLYGLLDRILD